jgi:hypothetical protein
MDRRHPGRDAILRAGFIACRRCGRRGWPSDAEWLADDLILAAYAAPCWHARALTQLTVPSELAEAAGPEPAWCRGTVRNGARKGRRCANRARPGAEFCVNHMPNRWTPQKPEPEPQCAGWVNAGTPRERQCRNRPEPGSGYCEYHQQQAGATR